jgi:hypothetical protein
MKSSLIGYFKYILSASGISIFVYTSIVILKNVFFAITINTPADYKLIKNIDFFNPVMTFILIIVLVALFIVRPLNKN